MRNVICGIAVTLLSAGAAVAAPHTIDQNEKAIKQDIKADKRDIKADRAELKRLRADLQIAERVHDRVRAADDRAAIRRLEADMKSDKRDLKQDKGK